MEAAAMEVAAATAGSGGGGAMSPQGDWRLRAWCGTPPSCALCRVEVLRDAPWFRCAECRPPAEDPDGLFLCLPCVRARREGRGHRAGHGVMVAPCPDLAGALSPGWTVREEVRLLEGVAKFGVGNWDAVAGHVFSAGKDAETCATHYQAQFLMHPALTPLSPAMLVQRERERERQRELDAQLRQAVDDLPNLPGGQLAGYMPLRDCYDVDFEQDAEALVCGVSFTPEESATIASGKRAARSSALEAKLGVLASFNARLDARERHKAVVREHKLLDTKRLARTMKRARREEREIRRAMRPFARYSTACEHEALVQGLARERELRARLARLRDPAAGLAAPRPRQAIAASLAPLDLRPAAVEGLREAVQAVCSAPAWASSLAAVDRAELYRPGAGPELRLRTVAFPALAGLPQG